jgi:hypothetical protein
MTAFNQLNFNEVYKKLRDNESFSFQATREELNFQNVENELTSVNFDMPFRLPLATSLENLVDYILKDSIGQIKIGQMDKIKILTEIFGGTIFYKRIGKDGKDWEIMIIFSAKSNK